MATRNLSIMFTDIKGFTQRTSASSREAMKALLEQHERLLLPVFAYFDGVVVKTIGDAFLVYFESPTDAVLCGVTIQEVLRHHNAKQAKADRLEVRVAINVGEVELEQGDVMGEAVNIAARLEGVTEAGEV
jgi:class 3 adenylate cyclase